MNNSIDRNQAIGLVLISGILIAYFAFFSPTPTPVTSIETAKTEKLTDRISKTDSLKSNVADTAALAKSFGSLADNLVGKSEETTVLENENVKITLSNKGAALKDALLKKYKTYAKEDLHVFNDSFFKVLLSANKLTINDLYFSVTEKTDTSVLYKITSAQGDDIAIQYSLPKTGYTLNYAIKSLKLANQTSDSLRFQLVADLPLTEKDLANARQTANITYRLSNGTYNSMNEASMDVQEEKFPSRINWLTFKQKFFNVGIIAPNGFNSGNIRSSVNQSDSSTVKSFQAGLTLSVADINAGKGNLAYYLGPNKLNIVSDVAEDYKENVYLGWPVIRVINRYTMAPLLSFLERFFSNYGIIIILMVLVIKIILLPLSYKAYYSMAKMKVLKPELDEIKARVGDDMAVMQQEQMKLYNSVGVNPLSGCIPVLMQMPILLAMFNFFPNAIELRQAPFLWAEDLSTFDTIAMLPFKIPFYGDHVSLFALLMTASTILYTWYNNQINVSATGPMIAMSYIMPLVFLFVLNSMPAGLSFYYFVSNMITIGQQFMIKQFVDEKAIREKLEENKKTAPTRKPNRFQQRLMDAMEQQKAMKAQQTTKKK